MTASSRNARSLGSGLRLGTLSSYATHTVSAPNQVYDMYTVQLLFCQCIQLILEQLVCHAVS